MNGRRWPNGDTRGRARATQWWMVDPLDFSLPFMNSPRATQVRAAFATPVHCNLIAVGIDPSLLAPDLGEQLRCTIHPREPPRSRAPRDVATQEHQR